MDSMEGKYNYQKPGNAGKELRDRENFQKGIVETTETVTTESSQTNLFTSKFKDAKEFAQYLGIPFQSLEMMMKEHFEKDPMVKQTIHEHVSFIKIEEGYPIFLQDNTDKLNNTIKLTPGSDRIGILDFYESLAVITKVYSALSTC